MFKKRLSGTIKAFIIVISSIIGLLLLAVSFSYIVYDRSLEATVIEFDMRVLGKPTVSNEKEGEAFVELRRSANESEYILPSVLSVDCTIESCAYRKMKYIVMNYQENPDHTIIFFHGGSYLDQILVAHYDMLDQIISMTNAMVIVPIYPLTPVATAGEVYPLLLDYWKEMLIKYDMGEIAFMGDSAGGGMALSLSLILKTTAIKNPDELILISPWVDAALETNVEELKRYEKKDPALDIYTLQYCALRWAGNIALDDPMISPINGDLSGLPETTLFVGTRELFYPDVTRLNDLLIKAGVKTTLYIGKGMNHDWPVYVPFGVSEAKKAVKEIAKQIMD